MWTGSPETVSPSAVSLLLSRARGSCSCLTRLTRAADWKGDTKLKKVNLFINLEGVSVTRVQTKKKDPRVGTWDWYHIKSWDVAPNHFAFKIVSSADASVINYMFETKQAKVIAGKFKEQVNAIMARKRKQKEAAQSGESSLEGTAGAPDWDPDALPVLATRTKIMKVEVKFQTNGMLAPPPKSSLARGQAAGGAGGGAAAAPAMVSVEVLETDNPMASLLDLFGGAAPARAPTPAPAPMLPPGAPLESLLGAPASMGGGGGGGGGGLFTSSPVPAVGGTQMIPPAMGLLDMQAPVAPAAPMAVLQPSLNAAGQPRTMAEIQATAAPNPFVMQQQQQVPPQMQQMQQPPNPFMPPPPQQATGINPFLMAAPQQQAAPPVQKPPNPFDSLI